MIQLAPTMTLSIALGSVHFIGTTGCGQRRVSEIVGGRFSGEIGEGQVLKGGMDWQTIHADGTISIDARYVLRQGDILIAAQAQGFRGASASGSIYFRVVFRFETADTDLSWINRSVFVADGERLDNAVTHHVFHVV